MGLDTDQFFLERIPGVETDFTAKHLAEIRENEGNEAWAEAVGENLLRAAALSGTGEPIDKETGLEDLRLLRTRLSILSENPELWESFMKGLMSWIDGVTGEETPEE